MSPQSLAAPVSALSVALVGLCAAGASGQAVNPTAFTSAAVCGECHNAIHAVWQQSMHSRAYSNGVFQAAYRSARETYSARRAQLCLSCHAPTVRETRDYAVKDEITGEGVTCDFCHSIRSVELDGTDKRVDVRVGRVKYGPLKHAQSPAHDVVDSELHGRSELCATCHEHRNEEGVLVLGTYSEWKAGPYAAEGKQCQDCHMPLIGGRVVVPGLTDAVRAGVNLHNVSGSHSVEQIRKAVTVKILGAAWLGDDSVGVRISVANVGSGHCFPTGLPLHRAILEVRLMDGGLLMSRRTVEFEKVLLNRRGTPVTREDEVFLDAHSVQKDTRLLPKENRTVSLSFYDVEARDAEVRVKLWYQYATRTVSVKDGVETVVPVEMKMLVAADRQNVARRR